METVEIRPHKFFIKGLAIVFIVAILAFDFYVFIDDSLRHRSLLAIIQVVFTIGVVATAYRIFRHASHKEPFVTLSADGIAIKNGAETFAWTDFQYAMLSEKDEHAEITLYGNFGERTIGVSMLDKSPQAIMDLIQAFKSYYS